VHLEVPEALGQSLRCKDPKHSGAVNDLGHLDKAGFAAGKSLLEYGQCNDGKQADKRPDEAGDMVPLEPIAAAASHPLIPATANELPPLNALYDLGAFTVFVAPLVSEEQGLAGLVVEWENVEASGGNDQLKAKDKGHGHDWTQHSERDYPPETPFKANVGAAGAAALEARHSFRLDLSFHRFDRFFVPAHQGLDILADLPTATQSIPDLVLLSIGNGNSVDGETLVGESGIMAMLQGGVDVR